MALLVERRYEFGLLDGLFSESAAGQGRIVLVDGVVASGKTELLRTFAEQRGLAGAAVFGMTGRRDQQSLPFGGIRQLVSAMPLPAARTQPLTSMMQAQGLADAQPAALRTFDIAHETFQLLLELSGQSTLLITVDDAQHVDEHSMECVLYVANHIRAARIMLLMAEAVHDGSMQPSYRIELIRQTNCRRLRLAPLSADGVAEILAQHMEQGAAHRLAPSCHAITGGNPLLVRALIEDQIDSPQPMHLVGPDTRPVIGDAFRQAVLTCLRRSGPGMLDVARAVAILGSDCTVDRVCALLHQNPADVERILGTLRLLGCVEHNHFKDSLFRQAVLDRVDPGDLAELHLAAARVLHHDEAGVTKVARYLVAAGGVPDEWGVEQLSRAAEELLRCDESAAAIECLEHALSGSTDTYRRATLRLLLLRAEWRNDPAAAARHLPQLYQDAGDLDADQMSVLLHYMLWDGREQDAGDLIDRLGHEHGAFAGQDHAALHYMGAWLKHSHPGLAARWAEANGAEQPDPSLISWPAKASAALGSVLSGQCGGATTATAESVLQATALNDTTVESVWPALRALIYADRLDTALVWCDSLLAESKVRGVAWWEAVFSACRADIALRYGDLPKAAGYANRAIAAVGVEGWGVGVGMPLGVLVSVGTVLGDHEAMQDHLRQPVPEAMFATGYGLPYLRARGRYYLANGWYDAALADFHRCGELMAEWGFEAPTLAPWRTDVAEVHLRLGNIDKARKLAKEQLDLTGTKSRRVHGVSLRILAATVDVRTRLRMLKETVELLQASGDRLELAQALYDLSRTHQSLGQSAKARMVSHRAGLLVQACRMDTTSSAIAEQTETTESRSGTEAVAPIPQQDTRRSAEPAATSSLTTSEHRVAALASLGYTNREISEKLHITVSTVEQHLTKIFRKLEVSKRTDLPADLQLAVDQLGKSGGKSGGEGLLPARAKVRLGTRRTLRVDTA